MALSYRSPQAGIDTYDEYIKESDGLSSRLLTRFSGLIMNVMPVKSSEGTRGIPSPLPLTGLAYGRISSCLS